MSEQLFSVTGSNFQAEVLESETPVLVNFFAEWCGPCRVIQPILEELDNERQDLRIVSLDVDNNSQVSAAYEVLSIPTMILFKGGQVIDKLIGARSKKHLEAELDAALA